jgi:hypothetical protein
MSAPFASYTICPECGRPNAEKRPACAACDTKLISEDRASHEWYVAHLKQERLKRFAAVVGGSLASVACLGFILVLTLNVHAAPGFALIGCTVLALITTYKSAEKLRHLQRFFRSMADQP